MVGVDAVNAQTVMTKLHSLTGFLRLTGWSRLLTRHIVFCDIMPQQASVIARANLTEGFANKVVAMNQ